MARFRECLDFKANLKMVIMKAGRGHYKKDMRKYFTEFIVIEFESALINNQYSDDLFQVTQGIIYS